MSSKQPKKQKNSRPMRPRASKPKAAAPAAKKKYVLNPASKPFSPTPVARARGADEHVPGAATPALQLVPASGVLSIVKVQCAFNQTSFSCIPLAPISFGLTLGATDPFAAYQTFYADIQALAAGANGVAPVRLEFYNTIYGTLVPKSVPFGAHGVATYDITPPPALLPSGPSIDLDGGLTYYMYVPSATVLNGWNTQAAPSGYSPTDIEQLYVALVQLLAKGCPHLVMNRNISLTPAYLKDASAFARNSPYYGQGAGVGAPFSSVELEGPFKSLFFGVLIAFDSTMPRSSRKLEYTSGDAISNFGLGLLPDFPTGYYKGALAPIYKFLDLDEVIYQMMIIWQDAVTKYAEQFTVVNTDTLATLLAGMQVPWSTFRIAIRQQIAWVFADSQSLGQALCPSVTTGAFQSFLMGSNCYAANPKVALQLPLVLNENLRMLMRSNYPYNTGERSSTRNRVMHIPVWGAFKNTVATNIAVEAFGNSFPMFAPEPTIQPPNIFDGSYNGSVADFNATELVQEAVINWNNFMDICSQFTLGSSAIGGSKAAGAFLQYTRYVNFPVSNVSELRSRHVNRIMKPYVIEKDIEIPNLERKNSKREFRKASIYNPPNSTIFNEVTVAISGMLTITEVHKAMFPQCILPVIEIVNNALPSQTQIQTSSKEAFYYPNNTVGNSTLNTRAMELASGLPNNVKGTAGEPTEFARYCMLRNKNGFGGFFGNLFSTIGDVAGLFSPEIGSVAKTIGGVANSLQI